jgi:LPS sulfotransferase NodH
MHSAHASAHAAANAAPGAPSVRRIERPVFIVSSPRSGSSLLFETLAKSPDACTIGGESHLLIDAIPALDAAKRAFESNRLVEADATADIVATLRERFAAEVFDRDLRMPAAGAIRLLEKTPKNSLRIPFLRRVFPDALFVYLYRDPRETLASMLEAWESGRFRTYPNLPGWSGLPWSLLLTPGWRDLAGRTLPEIVAAQWEATTRILLDDLATVPVGQRCVARYDALVADPASEIARICTAIGFGWDRPLEGGLPLANHTVSAPREDKWRVRESEIAPRLPALSATMERAAAFASR